MARTIDPLTLLAVASVTPTIAGCSKGTIAVFGIFNYPQVVIPIVAVLFVIWLIVKISSRKK